MNIRRATIEDIDILIKPRLDYLSTYIGNISFDEEMYVREMMMEN